jgi:hypothetical protein
MPKQHFLIKIIWKMHFGTFSIKKNKKNAKTAFFNKNYMKMLFRHFFHKKKIKKMPKRHFLIKIIWKMPFWRHFFYKTKSEKC